jgi:hypothetical protein
MDHEAALLELAAAVTRLSSSVEMTARVLGAVCEQKAKGEEPTARAEPPVVAAPRRALRVIEGGRCYPVLYRRPD